MGKSYPSKLIISSLSFEDFRKYLSNGTLNGAITKQSKAVWNHNDAKSGNSAENSGKYYYSLVQNNTSSICKISGNVNMIQSSYNSNYILMWNKMIDDDAVPYWINKDFINELGCRRAYISYRPKLIYEEN